MSNREKLMNYWVEEWVNFMKVSPGSNYINSIKESVMKSVSLLDDEEVLDLLMD